MYPRSTILDNLSRSECRQQNPQLAIIGYGSNKRDYFCTAPQPNSILETMCALAVWFQIQPDVDYAYGRVCVCVCLHPLENSLTVRGMCIRPHCYIVSVLSNYIQRYDYEKCYEVILVAVILCEKCSHPICVCKTMGTSGIILYIQHIKRRFCIIKIENVYTLMT